jgi:hypothetical protein
MNFLSLIDLFPFYGKIITLCFRSVYVTFHLYPSILQVFLFQKSALHKCNMSGKPAVVTRVVDSMTDNLRPTRAEATDLANAVLDGKLWTLQSTF